MIGKALYMFALILTLQFVVGDYCLNTPEKQEITVDQKTNIPCFVASQKPNDDPPTNNYEYNLILATDTVVGTASTTSTNIQKALNYTIKV